MGINNLYLYITLCKRKYCYPEINMYLSYLNKDKVINRKQANKLKIELEQDFKNNNIDYRGIEYYAKCYLNRRNIGNELCFYHYYHKCKVLYELSCLYSEFNYSMCKSIFYKEKNLNKDYLSEIVNCIKKDVDGVKNLVKLDDIYLSSYSRDFIEFINNILKYYGII